VVVATAPVDHSRQLALRNLNATAMQSAGLQEPFVDASKTAFPVRILHAQGQVLHTHSWPDAPIKGTRAYKPAALKSRPETKRAVLRVLYHHTATALGLLAEICDSGREWSASCT
jgi:hypothetical protein